MDIKKYFKYFVYISIIFLAYTLYQFDYLSLPRIYYQGVAFFSLTSIIVAYFAHSLPWWKVLNVNGYTVSFKQSVISVGLSIFGQYIPGKLWMIVGRSGYIAEKEQLPVGQLSMLSLSAQFTSLWISFLLGTIGLLFFIDKPIWFILSFTAFLLLTIIVFTDYFHNLTEWLVKKIFRKDLSIPRLYWRQTTKILPWFFIQWFFWSLGFYLLAWGLSPGIVSMKIVLVWPLAASLGILFIISPGGLGVREGVLTGCLVMVGIPIQEATTISVASRIWFLFGEIALFLLALILQRIKKE